MFATLESAQQQKAVGAGLSRLFFGAFVFFGAFGASLDFYRYGLHRPVRLGVEVLIFAVSVIWLKDSWTGLSGEKYKSRFVFLMILLILTDLIQTLWYS